MLALILHASKSDGHLADLFAEAREFAQVYVLARQTPKGFEGRGELATMKEEFRDAIDKVIKYCQVKKYVSEDMEYDLDLSADNVARS